MWRRREIKIEGGKYKNCGGGGKARSRRENKKKIVEEEENKIELAGKIIKLRRREFKNEVEVGKD